jgi:FkbM family methyltransferase
MMLTHSLLRTTGNLVPPISFLEKRICNFIQQRINFVGASKVQAGNGFWLTGDTKNISYLTGLNERSYMRLLGQMISDKQIVFNIGANTGYLALWLTKYFQQQKKSIKIIAFEPEPTNVEWLKENIALNHEAQIMVEACAVGAEDDKLTLWSSGRGDGSASFDKSWGGEKTIKHDVNVVKIDTYCQNCKYNFPDWMIMDVEGFGGKVIAGSKNILEVYKPSIAAEVHSKDELIEIESIILEMGYKQSFNLKSLWGNHIIWRHSN